MNEITNMQDKAREFSEKRNWTKFHNPKDLSIALLLEASEVLENFRFKQECNREALAKEIADVLNVLLRLSDVLEIDLIYWFNKKMQENEAKYPVEKCYGKNLKYSEV
jgi:NTP pyrophosphatase (non-canonical NTP hydrolase)